MTVMRLKYKDKTIKYNLSLHKYKKNYTKCLSLRGNEWVWTVSMLYDVQNKNVFSLRFKFWVLVIACLANFKWESVQALGAAMLKARWPNLSLDRGKNRPRFDADLRTVGRVTYM